MKYDVTFSCGHVEVKELFGKVDDRKKRIEWWERNCVCSECYRVQKEIEASLDSDEVEILYRDYKKDYSECRTKSGSWNAEKKTVIVYVTRKVVE